MGRIRHSRQLTILDGIGAGELARGIYAIAHPDSRRRISPDFGQVGMLTGIYRIPAIAGPLLHAALLDHQARGYDLTCCLAPCPTTLAADPLHFSPRLLQLSPRIPLHFQPRSTAKPSSTRSLRSCTSSYSDSMSARY